MTRALWETRPLSLTGKFSRFFCFAVISTLYKTRKIYTLGQKNIANGNKLGLLLGVSLNQEIAVRSNFYSLFCCAFLAFTGAKIVSSHASGGEHCPGNARQIFEAIPVPEEREKALVKGSLLRASAENQQRRKISNLVRNFLDAHWKALDNYSLDTASGLQPTEKQLAILTASIKEKEPQTDIVPLDLKEKLSREVSEDWFKEEGSEIKLKAQFFMAQIGSGKGFFEHYFKLLPEPDQKAVWKEIDRIMPFRLFRDLAHQSGIDQEVFDQALARTFMFERMKSLLNWEVVEGASVGVPESEIQLSRVTELQYALVMRESSQHPYHSSQEVQIYGKKIPIDINKVINVSNENISRYVNRLNQLQDDYTYRLATQEEIDAEVREAILLHQDTGKESPLISKNLFEQMFSFGFHLVRTLR